VSPSLPLHHLSYRPAAWHLRRWYVRWVGGPSILLGHACESVEGMWVHHFGKTIQIISTFIFLGKFKYSRACSIKGFSRLKHACPRSLSSLPSLPSLPAAARPLK